MTTLASAPLLDSPRAGLAHRRLTSRLPEGWLLYLLFFGYPLWWFLGLQAFIWPIVAVPMGASLLRRRNVRVPRGFGIWLLFFIWMLASALQINDVKRVLSFGYRGALYFSATVLVLYVMNLPDGRKHTQRIAYAVTSLWFATVVGGYAGILFSHVDFSSITEVLLPASVAKNPFIKSLVHLGFADRTTLLGFALARPKALYNYTNEWGSNLALLTPFAVYALYFVRRRFWRIVIAGTLVASLVPIVLSINRGLWISLSIGILYVIVRLGMRGHARLLGATLAGVAVALAVVVFTPLGRVAIGRIAHPNTSGRAYLYSSATDAALQSPVLGHGAPLPSSETGIAAGASVGTHGQLWTLLVSQGFPGVVLFVLFFVTMFFLTWRVSLAGLWPHAVILIGLSQLVVYNMLPVQIHTMMVAVVLAWRDVLFRRAPMGAAQLVPPPENGGLLGNRPPLPAR